LVSSHTEKAIYTPVLERSTPDFLTTAPTFFTAGIYIILGRLITLFGPHTSPIAPTTYLYIFCTCDVVSLVIQAIGGAMASKAVSSIPPSQSKTGTNIMVAGIVFQLVSITLFSILFGIFVARVRRMRPGQRDEAKAPEDLMQNNSYSKVRALVIATVISCLMIYIRSVYRTVELLQGWRGYLISREGYFIGFDAILMFVAVVVFNVVHPGWALPTSKQMTVWYGNKEAVTDKGSGAEENLAQ
jgi:hypothetical protein